MPLIAMPLTLKRYAAADIYYAAMLPCAPCLCCAAADVIMLILPRYCCYDMLNAAMIHAIIDIITLFHDICHASFSR